VQMERVRKCPCLLSHRPQLRWLVAVSGAALAVLLLPLFPIAAQEDAPTYESLMEQAQACKAKGDFQGMADAIGQALELGEGTEYAWRSLAWSLARSGHFERSFDIARGNVEHFGDTAWPLAQLADSALYVHDSDVTYEALSKAEQLEDDELGEAAGALKDAKTRWLGMFGKRRISVTWTIDPKEQGVSTPGHILWVRLPQLRHPRQDVTYEIVSGAKDGELVQSEDVDFLKVKYDPDTPIVIRTEAVLHSCTVPLERLRETDLEDIPPDIAEEFLAESTDVPIDPKGKTCQALIKDLKGETPYETVDNIMRWFRDNFTYKENPTQDSEGLLNEHFGVCHHYSVAISALCRAAGIPARIVGGEVFGWANEDDKSVVGGGSHGWVEVYLNPIGWVELDGLGYETFGAVHRSMNVYLRFHTVGHVGNPILPHEFSLQGSAKVEARLLEAVPAREL